MARSDLPFDMHIPGVRRELASQRIITGRRRPIMLVYCILWKVLGRRSWNSSEKPLKT